MKFLINTAKFVHETDKEIDGNNFLVAYDVPIAKTGIQQYTREEIGARGPAQELVNVYRDEKVFDDEELLKTFDGIPIVYRHPDNGKVDTHNFKDYVVGTVSGVYAKDGDLYAKKLTIIDKEAIINVLNKNTNELSIGFRGQIKEKKGVYKGVEYNFEEDVLHANHLALCENGKAGPLYAINSKTTHKETRKNMAKKSYTNSANGDFGGGPLDVGSHIDQSVRQKLSKVKPKNFGDNCMDSEEEHYSHLADEEIGEGEVKHHMKKEKEAEEHLEKDHAMGDEDEMEEKDHKDRDVVNSLKKANRRLSDLLNLKNSEIRRLEVKNVSLEDSLVEAREFMSDMAKKLKSRNLANAMTAPDLVAGRNPYHRSQEQLSQTITDCFLGIK